MTSDLELREAMIRQCRNLGAAGLNQGTSGNVSVRCGDAALITPSATPYETMTPDQIVHLPLDQPIAWRGPRPPSSEWRFHVEILRASPHVQAVVHTHSPYATAISMTRRAIPACHYLIAIFGGHDVRCAPYARYGTQLLAELAVQALEDRSACLLANHGAIITGASLEQAIWRATELEALARLYVFSQQAGSPVLLSEAEVEEARQGFSSYGVA